MFVEKKLTAWLLAGLALYASSAPLREQVFLDDSEQGYPTAVAAGSLTDAIQQQWVVNEWAGGTLRYKGVSYPILSNTASVLTITGNPSPLDVTLPYQILPVDVAYLASYLADAAKPIRVAVSYSRLPTTMPAITLRLEHEQQTGAYVGESLESTFADPTETDYVRREFAADYLLTIWTENPQETFWLYALLRNYLLGSVQQFAFWGLYNIGLQGSDLHPDMQFVPEQVYTRYLTFSCTRIEQAIVQRTVDHVTAIATVPSLAYAPQYPPSPDEV